MEIAGCAPPEMPSSATHLFPAINATHQCPALPPISAVQQCHPSVPSSVTSQC
ncbi:unnamed protein product, partial [Staurois parvus]